MLTLLGYQVTAESSSAAALELFAAAPDQYDLVLSDLAMPEMTGLEFITAIKKDPSRHSRTDLFRLPG